MYTNNSKNNENRFKTWKTKQENKFRSYKNKSKEESNEQKFIERQDLGAYIINRNNHNTKKICKMFYKKQ